MKIFKTIRFKLTLWYSLLLLLLSGALIFSLNVIFTRHYMRDPIGERPLTISEENPPPPPKWDQLDEERKELIREYRLKDLNLIRQVSILSFIPLSLFSFLGGYFISGQMLHPLKKLNKAMNEINVKNLKKRIKHDKTGDEISELIDNFNKMTSRLQNSFDSQKQFVENASHELKTPLAIIQTNLESLLDNKKSNKDELNKSIGKALEYTKFMNRLIEDLLLLSVLENHIKKSKLNIEEIVSDAIIQLKEISRNKSTEIDFDIDSNYSTKAIQANKTLLQRAIMNIIENSIKYSNKGKKVRVELSEENKNIIIRIIDQGPGIPKKEQKKIFERFYRVDKSRSRKSGGFGLGLSISKKIINKHRGSISVKSKQNKGSTFTIKIKVPDKKS